MATHILLTLWIVGLLLMVVSCKDSSRHSTEISDSPLLIDSSGILWVFDGQERAEIRCMVKGDRGPRVEWFKDGSAVLPSDRHSITPESTLMVHGLSSTMDAGNYFCKVTSSYGVFNGRRTTVMFAEPHLVSAPKNVSLSKRGSVLLYCGLDLYQGVRPNLPLEVYIKQGDAVIGMDLPRPFPGAVLISSITSTLDDLRCELRSTTGNFHYVSSAFSVRVMPVSSMEPMKVFINVSARYVLLNTAVHVVCTTPRVVEGILVEYNKDIVLADVGNVSSLTYKLNVNEPTLTVFCRAWKGSRVVQANVTIVTYDPLPPLEDKKSGLLTNVGYSKVRLDCQLPIPTDNQIINLTWWKDGSLLTLPVGRVPPYSIKLYNIKQSDEGAYQCLVEITTEPVRIWRREVFLFVGPEGPMVGPPRNLVAVDIKDTSAMVKWDPPLVGAQHLKHYILRYEYIDSPFEVVKVTIPASVTTYTIRRIFGPMLYKVFIYGMSELRGSTEPSNVIFVNTLTEPYSPRHVRNLTIVQRQGRRVQIYWAPYFDTDNEEFMDRYYVCSRNLNTSEKTRVLVYNTTRFWYNNLQYGYLYALMVAIPWFDGNESAHSYALLVKLEPGDESQVDEEPHNNQEQMKFQEKPMVGQESRRTTIFQNVYVKESHGAENSTKSKNYRHANDREQMEMEKLISEKNQGQDRQNTLPESRSDPTSHYMIAISTTIALLLAIALVIVLVFTFKKRRLRRFAKGSATLDHNVVLLVHPANGGKVTANGVSPKMEELLL